MSKAKQLGLFATTMVALAMAGSASAAVVTSLPGAKAEPMPKMAPYYFGSGPQVFGDGITWSATPAAWFGIDSPNNFGFGANGVWSSGPLAATDNYAKTSMQFAFAAPIAGFLGEINWSPTHAETLTAYDALGQVLDAIQFSNGAGNLLPADAYYGFEEKTASISRVVFSGSYFGVRNISVLASPPPAVPEPAIWAMMLMGFFVTGAVVRRRGGSTGPVRSPG